MSMVGCLKRATDEQLAQLLAEPGMIRRFLYGDLADVPYGIRVGCLARLLGFGGSPAKTAPLPAAPLPDDWPASAPEDEIDLDKSWNGLHYLMTGEGWEGEEPLCFLIIGGETIGDIDVGYGPARALSSEQVRRWAEALAVLTREQLRERFDPDEMTEIGIYPSIWDEGDEAFEYLWVYFGELVKFVQDTAGLNKGLVVWLA